MNRRLLLLALLLPTACHRQPAAPPAKQRTQAQPARTEAHSAPVAQPAEETKAGAAAADMLRRYYALIEAGKYDAAWAMRTAGQGMDAGRFAAHFKAYARYHSEVGVPSRPVQSEGWVYVEVPVMTTGRFLGGKPFGSAGSVSLRRPAPVIEAPPGERGWRIYTG
ncbi:MAG: hypothetical protein JWO81_2414 [Alphaproteobacteria bacterium]|nr:hypothetical protein [Alphaproteobacteria bacterium]